MPQIYLTSPTASWAQPSDWNPANNTIEIIGTGGMSPLHVVASQVGGSAGGAYAVAHNVAPTFPVPLTWTGNATTFGSYCSAANGANGAVGSSAGNGNQSAYTFPSGYIGGGGGPILSQDPSNWGYPAAVYVSGGGGAAGPSGNGSNGGQSGSYAIGGAANGGTVAPTPYGTLNQSNPAPHGTFWGGLYGSGAGQGPSNAAYGDGDGQGGFYGGGSAAISATANPYGTIGPGPGIIVITYTPPPPPGGQGQIVS